MGVVETRAAELAATWPHGSTPISYLRILGSYARYATPDRTRTARPSSIFPAIGLKNRKWPGITRPLWLPIN